MLKSISVKLCFKYLYYLHKPIYTTKEVNFDGKKNINLNIINKNSYQKYFYNKLKSYTTNNIVLTKYNSFGTYKQNKICLSHF